MYVQLLCRALFAPALLMWKMWIESIMRDVLEIEFLGKYWINLEEWKIAVACCNDKRL
jgi:hypothetical protein